MGRRSTGLDGLAGGDGPGAARRTASHAQSARGNDRPDGRRPPRGGPGTDHPRVRGRGRVPERILREWLEIDASFATALRSAHALAEAHGLRPGTAPTPAALQLMLNAIRKGRPGRPRRPSSGSRCAGSTACAPRRPRGSPDRGGPAGPFGESGQRPAAQTPEAANRRVGYRIVQLDDPSCPRTPNRTALRAGWATAPYAGTEPEHLRARGPETEPGRDGLSQDPNWLG